MRTVDPRRAGPDGACGAGFGKWGRRRTAHHVSASFATSGIFPGSHPVPCASSWQSWLASERPFSYSKSRRGPASRALSKYSVHVNPRAGQSVPSGSGRGSRRRTACRPGRAGLGLYQPVARAHVQRGDLYLPLGAGAPCGVVFGVLAHHLLSLLRQPFEREPVLA